MPLTYSARLKNSCRKCSSGRRILRDADVLREKRHNERGFPDSQNQNTAPACCAGSAGMDETHKTLPQPQRITAVHQESRISGLQQRYRQAPVSSSPIQRPVTWRYQWKLSAEHQLLLFFCRTVVNERDAMAAWTPCVEF
jgi:hypothetical protein